MLQSIRDKTSGWIAYLIIGLISIPFALWGINSYLGGGEQQPAAIVNGEEITPRQLDYAYARYRERLSTVFGGNIPSAFGDEMMLKEQVLSQIIEERVLLDYIQDQGFRVGDERLFAEIRTMPAFQQDGIFSKELYREQLASQGYLPAAFEQELRRSSEMQQVSKAINSTAFTVPVQLERYNQLQNQSRKLRTLTVENNSEAMSVSEDEINDYYEKQAGMFMEPAKVKVDYIELSLDSVKQGLEVNEEDLRNRYEQMADQLTNPEVRTASHILITVPSDADDAASDEARQKLLGIKSRIEQGEAFADLAREFSNDPGSAADGGDLGEVERGMMVKPFEASLFALQENELSAPVKTQFGWHLIKLHEVSGGDKTSFEQARFDIEEEIKAELAESQIYDLAENLANIGYEQPDSLLPASEQLELKIQTTDWFSRSQGEGLAEDPKIRQVAFSDDVLTLNRNSDTLELEGNRIVIMHLNSHQPTARKALEQVRDELIDTLKKKKGRSEAEANGKTILEAVLQGQSLDEAAVQEGLSVFDAGFVDRNNTVLDRDVLNAAFRMNRPQGPVVFEGVTEVDGDYTIIELSEVQSETGSESSSSDEPGADPVKTLTDAAADHEYQVLIQSLTAQADIQRTPVAELQ